MISLEQKKLSDYSVFHIYKNSAGILASRAGRVEPGPDLVVLSSRAGRVG